MALVPPHPESLHRGAAGPLVEPERTRADAAALARTNATYAAASALLDELAAGGVRAVCICPGSRSAPLAVVAASHPDLSVYVHLDERSAAFFALGLAKASDRPVALVCTSGTAAANFLPAVVEADLGRVPLVVLTADRPPALRDWGAPQTIRQPGLYQSFVRFESETELPRAATYDEAPLRALACRAVHEATGARPGPVHLNVPFEEPLAPEVDAGFLAPELPRTGVPVAKRSRAEATPSAALVDEVVRAIGGRRGVIVCGPQRADADLCEAILDLATAAGWPVIADLASQLRCGRHAVGAPVLAAADAWLRDSEVAEAHPPEIVLQFGAPSTSKAVGEWIARSGAECWTVDAAAGRRDPRRQVARWVEVDPLAFCGRVTRRLLGPGGTAADPAWRDALLRIDTRAAREIERQVGERGPLDGLRAARAVADALPSGAALFLSNSLAVRDAESVVPCRDRSLRVFANRGANGIDGVVSSALGAAAGGPEPLALLVGDLAFLHDLPALARARHHGASATIVVLDDDGGGIFSHLPIAEYDGSIDFETLFRVPHGADFASIARAFGHDHVRVTDAADLTAAVRDSLAAPGIQIVQVPIDPERNLANHRALWARVAARVGEALG